LCLFFVQFFFISLIFRPRNGLIPLMNRMYPLGGGSDDLLSLTLRLPPYKQPDRAYTAAQNSKKGGHQLFEN
ncbi:hypothetical protein, partial [Pantoea piersonii]|uniref:hypothetical protein n=1 Tax=Pantoea piersonii TaxID=2364647 RepID=UPI001D6A4F26